MCRTAWSGEAGAGARKATSGTGGKKLLWGQPISDMMHNHIPNPLGFVSTVPGVEMKMRMIICSGYLSHRSLSQTRAPLGLGALFSLSPAGPQGKT